MMASLSFILIHNWDLYKWNNKHKICVWNIGLKHHQTSVGFDKDVLRCSVISQYDVVPWPVDISQRPSIDCRCSTKHMVQCKKRSSLSLPGHWRGCLPPILGRAPPSPGNIFTCSPLHPLMMHFTTNHHHRNTNAQTNAAILRNRNRTNFKAKRGQRWWYIKTKYL